MTAEDIIKQCEGCKLTAYTDSGGRVTIGWGHALDVSLGDIWTQSQADACLVSDINKVQAQIKSVVTVPLTDNQLSALTSFVYNLGIGNLQRSGLLKMLNREDYSGAADQFLLWDKIGMYKSPGLQARRSKERALFLE
jgi:lysozyme